MNIKHMFITLLALLPLTTTFHINGMLIRTKALPILPHQQILRYCSQLPKINKCSLIKDTNIVSYNRERDEKIVSNIASNYLPELMSDVTPNSQHERLQELMTTINGNENISKVYLLNNKPIGFINYYIAQPYIRCLIAPHAHVNWLAIDDEHQDKGIGSALLRNTFDECDKLSVGKITLRITDWHLENYYHKFDFICTKRSKFTGVQELTKRLQPHPVILLYKAMLTWLNKLKE